MTITGILIITFGVVALCYVLAHKYDVEDGHCANCGYDLRASMDRCPECGLPVPPKEGEPLHGMFDDLFLENPIAPRKLPLDERTVQATSTGGELTADFFQRLFENHGIACRVEGRIRQGFGFYSRAKLRIMVGSTDLEAARKLVDIVVQRLAARYSPPVSEQS